jgi:RNA polymerase sigma factor (sigma-70 family)
VTRDAARRQRFDALFEAHRLDVASYCCWRTASMPDAEDAVAEVFLIAWRRIDAIPADDAARAWLYATARRVTANQRRSRRRFAALAERLGRQPQPDRSPTAPGNGDAAGTQDARVHAALARLGERDREVLLLVEWEGLRPAELAAVLGCREVTARGRLHRARRRFRDAFEAMPRAAGAVRVDPHVDAPRPHAPATRPSSPDPMLNAAGRPIAMSATRKAQR